MGDCYEAETGCVPLPLFTANRRDSLKTIRIDGILLPDKDGESALRTSLSMLYTRRRCQVAIFNIQHVELSDVKLHVTQFYEYTKGDYYGQK